MVAGHSTIRQAHDRQAHDQDSQQPRQGGIAAIGFGFGVSGLGFRVLDQQEVASSP